MDVNHDSPPEYSGSSGQPVNDSDESDFESERQRTPFWCQHFSLFRPLLHDLNAMRVDMLSQFFLKTKSQPASVLKNKKTQIRGALMQKRRQHTRGR
jgi:hypothetical protein